MKVRYWGCHTIVLWTCLVITGIQWGSARPLDRLVAKAGILDLNGVDLRSRGPLDLDGEWEFYPHKLFVPDDFGAGTVPPEKQFITLPALWEGKDPQGQPLQAFGFATYRLTVIHPLGETLPRMALYLSNYLSSYELWVDGVPIAQNGKVGDAPEKTTHQWLPKLVSFEPSGEETVIVLQVANFKHRKGGVSKNPQFGILEQLERVWMADILVHAFVLGAYFLMAVFFFGVYLFWQEDRSVIYFITFSLLFSFRYFLIGPRFGVFLFPDFFSFDLALRLEYLTVYLGIPFIVTFVAEMFPQLFSRTVLRVIQAIGGLCALLVLSTPVWVFTELAVPFTLFLIVISMYGVWVIIQATRQKERGSYMGLAGLGFGSLLLVIAAGDYLGWFQGIQYATELGIFVFILFQALSLARRLTDHVILEKKIKDETLEEKAEILSESQVLGEANERIWAINSRLENEIIQRTQKLRSAYSELADVNKELDLFLYRYSHDLRSPITTLMGLNEVAETAITETNAQRLFGHVKLTVVKMDILVRKLMKLHDINTNEGDQLETLSLSVVVKDIVESYRSTLDEHEVSVECQLDHVPLISTHLPLLQIVLENAIENAAYYYSKETGRLRTVTIQGNIVGEFLLMTIRDNGMGIKEEIKPNIFDMFYRGTTRSPGSGLGLYLVEKALEKLQGEIEITSIEEEFTEVSIRIPI